MTISDSDFLAWARSARRRPVVLVTLNVMDDTDTPQVLRVATRRYTTATNVYRGRLVDFELDWEMEPGVAGYSEPQLAELEIVNDNRRLDAWKGYRFDGQVQAWLGDRSWDIADFRSQFVGQVTEFQSERDRFRITCRDTQRKLDEIAPAADFTITAKKIGSALLQMLQTPTGPFAPTEIDTAAFTALDTTFPWNLSQSESEDANRLDVIDAILQGFPIDYGPDTAGKITARVWSQPTGSSIHKTIKPLAHPEIERIEPLGEITLKGDGWEVTREDATIKANYPGYRTESFTVALDSQTDAEALGDDRLARFNRPFDRLEYPVGLALFGLELGDEVPIQFPYLGYESGQYGRVTRITRRLRAPSTMEVWV
ncbi:MAG: hypothetical protein DWQ08_08745 [Proteobacteria bacterium]|nr:MAG: hypothetical protein DWQ08_08745 [Pseudomonadota bacterium]